MDVSAGLALPGADFGPIAESYWKATLGVIILYYSALWAVKVSFLLLFKRLGTNVQKQNWLWWPVFLFTLATYFACIGDIYYPCLTRPMAYVIANCATPAAGNFNQVTLKVNCAWDVLTDFLSELHEPLSSSSADPWCSYVDTVSLAPRHTDEHTKEVHVDRYLLFGHRDNDLLDPAHRTGRVTKLHTARQLLAVPVVCDRGFGG